ncbi:MAG: ExbD/TolR family protein [Planctomycetota bacterium]
MPRRGRKRRQREGSEEIPVGSFSDIAFLLIIFFIVAASLVKTRAFEATIPSSESKEEKSEEDEKRIVLAGDRILWDSEPMTFAELKAKLASLELDKMKEDDQDRFVMLETQSGTLYKRFYRVWAAIAEAGGNVALVEREGGE